MKAVGNVVGQGHRRHLGQVVVAGVEQYDFAAVDPGVVNGGTQVAVAFALAFGHEHRLGGVAARPQAVQGGVAGFRVQALDGVEETAAVGQGGRLGLLYAFPPPHLSHLSGRWPDLEVLP